MKNQAEIVVVCESAVHMPPETPDHLVALRDPRNFIPLILIHPVAFLYKPSGGVINIFFRYSLRFSRSPGSKTICAADLAERIARAEQNSIGTLLSV